MRKIILGPLLSLARHLLTSSMSATTSISLNATDEVRTKMSKSNKAPVASNANTQAPAKKTRKTKAPKNVIATTLTLSNDGATDALKGRLACRTSVIHTILVSLYNDKGAEATLNTKTITDEVNRQWARATEGGRPTSNAATASHMNTMKSRQYVEHGADGRGWRLSKLGAEVLTKGAPQA